MVRPSLHTEPYDAILPSKLQGANKDKIAVVTGAARGIGRAIACSLAQSGAHLALLDIDVERQADTKQECENSGVRVITYACDVTNFERCQKVFAEIVRDMGPVDVLVNNAGRNNRKPMSMEPFDEFWAGVELNLKGAMVCSWLTLPLMRDRGYGCIINIASRAGTVTVPFAGAYSCGKAGLIRATACLQAELEVDGFGDRIHVYALHPGAVKSAMTVPVDADVAARYPSMAEKWAAFHKLFRVLPTVCGQTCAFLAAGYGKVLRGKYFDCEQDIAAVIQAGRSGLAERYELKVDFLGELPNDGGTAMSIERGKV